MAQNRQHPEILYIDLEVDKKGKIRTVGGLLGKQELREHSNTRLAEWIDKADFICGHNVIAHDLPVLKDALGRDPIKGKPAIDTLLWSPLLFPERPYHKLVKGYKLINEDAPNDPLSDSKLCKHLLQDEVEAFTKLDAAWKAILHGLLGQQPAFQGFFQLVGYQPEENGSVGNRIHDYFWGRLCANASITKMAADHPVELAYVLALINTETSASVLPEYVVHEHPVTKDLLNALRFTACTQAPCSYCLERLDIRAGLKRVFGYEDFRLFAGESGPGLQERAVRSAVQGRSLLAVFPTGGGKSITFQLPALMQGELTRDLTVVISPLVSLMKDQVDVLKSRHDVVNAAFISSLLAPLERDEAVERVANGEVHMLYLSPESLRSPTIHRLLSGRHIARFVIDEAHCFSAWGHDFRVDYLYIAEFIKDIQEAKGNVHPIAVSCFTATAKPQVIDDIRSYFKERLGLDLELFVTRAPRENLEYEVIHVEDTDDRKRKLVAVLRENPGPAIVYVHRTKRVGDLVELLEKSGIGATGYHGQMDRDEKQRNQNAFMAGEFPVMVATSAFGMGVDKEDIRTVVHYNISGSLEDYMQEAGRAGRSKDIEAKCFVLFNEQDLEGHFRLHQANKLNQKEIDQVWWAIKNLTKVREQVSKSALEIAHMAGWDEEVRDLETRIRTAVSVLEERGYVERKLNYTTVKATSMLVRNVSEAVKRIKAREDLDEKQKEDCIRMVQRIVKNADQDGEARIDYLADTLGMSTHQAQTTVDLLRQVEILADGRDMDAFLNLQPQARKASRKRAKLVFEVEKELLKELHQEPERITLRALCQRLKDAGIVEANNELVHSFILFWGMHHVLGKERIDREAGLYRLWLRHPVKELQEKVERRHAVAAECLAYLEQQARQQPKAPADRNLEEVRVTFSLQELKQQVETRLMQGPLGLPAVESALRFLNELGVIKLQGGFMVYFQRLRIVRKEQNTRKRFTLEDYEQLRQFYQSRVQQIHFVGEYARRRLRDYGSALAFVDDYFKMPYEGFVKKYFPERRTEITRTMTERRFKELFGQLSLEQKMIVDEKAKHILVSAGPGSGKTRVLVHKIASLLLLEDVKPEQFLMLTFSRSAVLDFREKIHKLVPEYKWLVRVSTFHGFSFDLLSEVGSLEKADQVIEQATALILDKEENLPNLEKKSVLVLDEFQDMTAQEWALVQAIAKRNPDMRIIAVGDDDQNIFEWRGASVAHWQTFREQFSPKEFSLLTNFRSTPDIVACSSHIIEPVANRSKTGQIMMARDKEPGEIVLCRHRSPHLATPVVNELLARPKDGTMAVLARKNEEVLILASTLEKAGFKVRTIGASEGFYVGMLDEVRRFTDLLEVMSTEVRTVTEEAWRNTKDHFLHGQQANPLLADLQDIIMRFETDQKGRYELALWQEFIRDLRMEEVVMTTKDTVLVTTLHKAKGREFDEVILMLPDLPLATEEDRRLLYVACTRAKRRLSIHTGRALSAALSLDTVRVEQDDTEYPPPTEVDYIANLKEVHLDSMKPVQQAIAQAHTGHPLVVNGTFQLQGLNGQMGFSRKMKTEVFERFVKAGYTPAGGRVEYKVHWYKKEDRREYQVVVPRLRFVRG